MNRLGLTNDQLLVIFGVTLSSILIGFVLDKIILRLRKRSARNRMVNLRIFFNTIQGPIRIWAILAAIVGLGWYFDVEPDSVLGWIVNGSFILLIVTFIYVLSKVIQTSIAYYVRKGRLPNTTIFNSLAYITVILVGTMLVLTAMGISITPLLAALGVGGLAVALALQPTLANLFAGISLVASKQINPGDFVEIDIDQAGTIEDIHWRTTSIRTVHNNLIIIPNSVLSNLRITNYSLPLQELSLPIQVGVHYDSDLDHVRDVCLDIATDIQQNEAGAVASFEPRVRFKQFGPSSIDLNVVLRIKSYVDQFHIKSEFIRRLRKRFKEEGIIIPYPITTVEFAGKRQPRFEEDS